MAKSLISESMNILEEMLKTPGATNILPPHPDYDMPDISKINLDKIDEGSIGHKRLMRMHMSSIKSFSPKHGKGRVEKGKRADSLHDKVKLKRKFRKDQKEVKESKVKKIQSLLNEAQKLIDEITGASIGTTVGSIGVNMGGPGRKSAGKGVIWPTRYRRYLKNTKTKKEKKLLGIINNIYDKQR
jgi:hypothetical protein